MDPVTVGGTVLSAFLQVLFDRLASRAVLDFFKAKKLDNGLLRKLKITLIAVDKVLDDAEEKRFTDEKVKEWVEELQDAVYDAEDLLDAVNTEAMLLQMEKEPKKAISKLKLKVRNIFKSCTHSHGKIETTLKEILERSEDIVKPIDLLGLKQGVAVGVPENPNKRLPTTSLPDERKIYGRDKDKESVVKLLLAENTSDDKLSVITIKGMAGVGKTTLAQLVYNDNEIVQHFEFKAWVCISEEFDVVKVTRTILQAVTSSISVTDDLDLLQVELKKALKDKRFLVVLDDVWNEKREGWDLLKKPFQHGAKGGKILVTTRNEGVAQIMRTVPTHTLEKLSDEDCWELFAKYAFEGGESQAHPSLRDMRPKIVKKCGGLPLAAKALGGLLRSKKTVEEWSQIMESNLWDLKNCNILPVLRVSYRYLLPRLKRCFAFASIFPKDYEFRKDKLILLWAAQSFFPEGKNVLDIGGNYFNELLSRSFFQISSTYDPSRFVMHDLMHDLATFVSGQSFRSVNRGDIQEITNTTRHVSYYTTIIQQFQTPPTANRLRTFIPLYSAYYSHIEISKELATRSKVLRALSLPLSDMEVLPATIGSLKHLRFFDLSRTSIKSLPNSVCDLYNLQTLILFCCSKLIELPTDIWKLVNLHYLDASGCYGLREMPRNLGMLKNLAILGIFKVGKDSNCAKIGELGQLSNLGGELSILGLQNVKSAADAAEARLEDKKYLDELELSWDSDEDGPRKDYEVLEKLQPHRSLKMLTINGYVGERFPNWIGDEMYSNTVSLTLENCSGCRSIPALGQLPSLKKLYICGFANLQTLDSEFYGNSNAAKPFGSLDFLRIKDMPLWEEWFCRDGESFPLLREFYLRNCPKLRGNLPAHLPTLIKLEIYDCPDLTILLPEDPALSNLRLRNCNEMLLNHSPHGLQSLEIEALPGGGLPSSLTRLLIFGCEKFMGELLDRGLHGLNSLENLIIGKCKGVVSFPPEGLLPKSLAFLEIHDFDDLETLEHRGFEHLTSLSYLEIRRCPKLKSIPPEGLPASLMCLDIRGCPLLRPRLGRDGGVDWDKIAHIPDINIY